ncbi:hypothetical protein V2J09_011674 [Rumex salicifolius]
MTMRGTRSVKVKRIFHQFDADKDGGLSRSEMAALVVAVNPRVKFSDDQLTAILDEVFRTYADFIDDEKGLSFEGLLRTYDDGAGDVDRDFEALGLDIDSAETAVADAEASSSSSIVGEKSFLEPQKKLRTAAWASSSSHGIVFDDTWKIVDDLEIIVKQLMSKQAKDGAFRSDISDVHSDAGWSRELGPSMENSESKRVVWVEFGHDYAAFLRELGALRTRADGARSREEAYDGHMALGRVLYEHEMFKEALVSFKRACDLQPIDVRPHFRAGNCLYALGKPEKAQEEFQLALEAAENGGNQWGYLLPQIHVNLGIALEGQGMVLSACEHYREAAILYPTHYRALKLLGSALFGVGENKAALKALEEAISMKSDYVDAHCDLASALHALSDDERAIVEFQKAIDLSPVHIDALYNLGGLYMDIGRFQRAAEMYSRVLALRPNHWQAQLNKAVSLLGAGESDEAKKAMKEALKMTNRVEMHDAIIHLKQLHKKKKPNGENAFIVVEHSKFKTVGDRAALRQDLAHALEIRSFQRISSLGCCDVEAVRREMQKDDVPSSFSGSGIPEKMVRKSSLEGVLHRLLSFLKPEMFQQAVKAINERILSVLDESGSGRVDIGLFYAVISPICGGPPDKRKRVAFEALLSRSMNNGSSELTKHNASLYMKLLRAIYIHSNGVSEIEDSNESTVSLQNFIAMFDDPDSGFNIMPNLVKLETGDRVRHGKKVCCVCRYPIIGSRFKEVKAGFNLCNQCYSEGKVPSAAKLEVYTFKEYQCESTAVKDKCKVDEDHNCIHLLKETSVVCIVGITA